jgi:ABC-type nickel/cobalt efflux system permease component RcnA|tara:strand:+ start:1946 stop:2719 length:774 start_codon:yes stop_codon:yes gene_type:complete
VFFLDTDSGAIAVVILGFLLGLKHATDADHVVAVGTIVSEYRNAFRSLWIGASWGLGHTAPLLILGIVILLLKSAVMDFYEGVAHYFEFGVAIMLVFLGLQVYWNLRRRELHVHEHAHDGDAHMHIHGTHSSQDDPSIEERHSLFNPGRPFFRAKSFVIGFIHGMAGSAAVMLVLLPTIDSFMTGLGYLILFGVGTVFSMALITILLSVPFVLGANNRRITSIVNGVAGTASIIFGLLLMSDIAFDTGLTDPFYLPF